MKNSKYVVKVYNKIIVKHEFDNIKLPKYLYPIIKK